MPSKKQTSLSGIQVTDVHRKWTTTDSFFSEYEFVFISKLFFRNHCFHENKTNKQTKKKQPTTPFIKAFIDYQVDTFNLLFGNKTLNNNNKKRAEVYICSCI